MTISKKQLEANKKNAQKGGAKTQEGKAIVKYNALKHGLLAKEVVIAVGEGAESPEEFDALLEDLKTQLAPAGTLEEMLVEKVAVAYWRLRRTYKYEVGLIGPFVLGQYQLRKSDRLRIFCRTAVRGLCRPGLSGRYS